MRTLKIWFTAHILSINGAFRVLRQKFIGPKTADLGQLSSDFGGPKLTKEGQKMAFNV